LRKIQRENGHGVANPHTAFFEGIADLIDFLGDLPECHLVFDAVEGRLIGSIDEIVFENVYAVVVKREVRNFHDTRGVARHSLFSREGNTAGRLFRSPSKPASRSGLKNPIISRTMA